MLLREISARLDRINASKIADAHDVVMHRLAITGYGVARHRSYMAWRAVRAELSLREAALSYGR